MNLAILSIAHITYLLGMFNGLSGEKGTGVLRGVLLTLLCWQVNSLWGIITLCYTSLLSLATLLALESK